MWGEKMITSELINEIIELALKRNASDIHIHPEGEKYSVKLRIDGLLQDLQAIEKDEANLLLSSIKVKSKLDIAQKRMPQDGSFKHKGDGISSDIRVSTINTVNGEKMVLRLFRENPSVKTFHELGMNEAQQEVFEKLLRIKSGMILVTGPTGSGKTTTLYTALNHIKDNSKNFITIEDPVEYQLEGITQINIDHKLGLTFPSALRAILRQDPDGILIGEIRDRETAEIAIRASLTGHIVLSTLHTDDCQSAILRLIDMGIDGYLIAGAIKGIVAQRLYRILCSCEEDCLCNGIGYYRRKGIFEVLPVTENLRTDIINGNRKFNTKSSYMTLQEAAQEKVLEGLTDQKEIYRVIGD